MGKTLKVFGGLVVVGMIGLAVRGPVAPLPEAPPRFLANRADSVALDWRTGEMYIRTTVLSQKRPHPTRVWVWAFFVNDVEGFNTSRSDLAIEIPVDFSTNDTAVVEARGTFHWRETARRARDGTWYARVLVSGYGADSVTQLASQRDRDVSTMTRVTVRR